MPEPLILAEPDRPFWGFSELLLATAIFIVGIITVGGVAVRYLHAPLQSGLWSVVEEAGAYAVLFIALKMMFARHGKPLLGSLGWSTLGPFKPLSLLCLGFGLYLIAVILEYILLTPNVETSFDKLLESTAGRIAIALFGTTLAPVVEELLFRGFLQPVLIDAAGVFPGILLTSMLFGGLHLMQNDFIWQSGVVIMIVGFVLGTVRHVTGSTKASSIVHIAYNLLPFAALVAAGNSFAK